MTASNECLCACGDMGKYEKYKGNRMRGVAIKSNLATWTLLVEVLLTLCFPCRDREIVTSPKLPHPGFPFTQAKDEISRRRRLDVKANWRQWQK